MIGRQNTIRLRRLLQRFIGCDCGDRQQLEALREKAKRVLGLDGAEPACATARPPGEPSWRH